MDISNWNNFKDEIQKKIILKTRDEWDEIFLNTDVCYSPVLSIDETHENDHMKKRNNFLTINDVIQPAPAPRFSKTKSSEPKQAPTIGEDNNEILLNLGYKDEDISKLKKDNIIN
jgi:alpha-methylacyl-CoA racemase